MRCRVVLQHVADTTVCCVIKCVWKLCMKTSSTHTHVINWCAHQLCAHICHQLVWHKLMSQIRSTRVHTCREVSLHMPGDAIGCWWLMLYVKCVSETTHDHPWLMLNSKGCRSIWDVLRCLCCVYVHPNDLSAWIMQTQHGGNMFVSTVCVNCQHVMCLELFACVITLTSRSTCDSVMYVGKCVGRLWLHVCDCNQVCLCVCWNGGNCMEDPTASQTVHWHAIPPKEKSSGVLTVHRAVVLKPSCVDRCCVVSLMWLIQWLIPCVWQAFDSKDDITTLFNTHSHMCDVACALPWCCMCCVTYVNCNTSTIKCVVFDSVLCDACVVHGMCVGGALTISQHTSCVGKGSVWARMLFQRLYAHTMCVVWHQTAECCVVLCGVSVDNTQHMEMLHVGCVCYCVQKWEQLDNTCWQGVWLLYCGCINITWTVRMSRLHWTHNL